MATKAYQRVYTQLDAITKATVSLKAKGVTNDELATVAGRLSLVTPFAFKETVALVMASS